jgi:hypothetical protein
VNGQKKLTKRTAKPANGFQAFGGAGNSLK